MTNKERFISVFGESSYNNIVNVAKEANAINIFEWLLDEYFEPVKRSSKEDECIKADEEIVKETMSSSPVIKESIKRKQPKGSGYDLKWYVSVVEDFYLTNEETLNFALKDDQSSGKKPKTISGMKSRFMVAVDTLHLKDEIEVHRYYQNTVNECVVLSKPMNFNGNKFAKATIRR